MGVGVGVSHLSLGTTQRGLQAGGQNPCGRLGFALQLHQASPSMRLQQKNQKKMVSESPKRLCNSWILAQR